MAVPLPSAHASSITHHKEVTKRDEMKVDVEYIDVEYIGRITEIRITAKSGLCWQYISTKLRHVDGSARFW